MGQIKNKKKYKLTEPSGEDYVIATQNSTGKTINISVDAIASKAGGNNAPIKDIKFRGESLPVVDKTVELPSKLSEFENDLPVVEGGKIDTISFKGEVLPIVDKNVNLPVDIPTNSDVVEYIRGYGIKDVDNIEGLRAIVGHTEGEVVRLLGYYEAGDKPELLYKWKTGSFSDDGGSIIVSNGGCWEALFKYSIDIRDYGARNNTDCTEQIEKIFEKLSSKFDYINSQNYEVIIPVGIYEVNKTLMLPPRVTIRGITPTTSRAIELSHSTTSCIQATSSFTGKHLFDTANPKIKGGVREVGITKVSSWDIFGGWGEPIYKKVGDIKILNLYINCRSVCSAFNLYGCNSVFIETVAIERQLIPSIISSSWGHYINDVIINTHFGGIISRHITYSTINNLYILSDYKKTYTEVEDKIYDFMKGDSFFSGGDRAIKKISSGFYADNTSFNLTNYYCESQDSTLAIDEYEEDTPNGGKFSMSGWASSNTVSEMCEYAVIANTFKTGVDLTYRGMYDVTNLILTKFKGNYIHNIKILTEIQRSNIKNRIDYILEGKTLENYVNIQSSNNEIDTTLISNKTLCFLNRQKGTVYAKEENEKTPYLGQLIFDTTKQKLRVYSQNGWKDAIEKETSATITTQGLVKKAKALTETPTLEDLILSLKEAGILE